MASIVKEVTVNADAEACWDAVRDFSALHRRLAPGFIVDLKMIGERERQVTFAGGAVAREYLVGIADESMRLVYSVVESPMGNTHNNSSVQVIRDGENHCRFVWIVDVLPDALAERTAELMDSALIVMKKTLESAVPDRGRPIASPH